MSRGKERALRWALGALLVIFGALALNLVAALTAQAQTLRAANNSGGEIVLTQRVCGKHAALREGYTYIASGQVTMMCWAYIDGMIHVVWEDDGARTVFKPELFRFVGAKEGS